MANDAVIHATGNLTKDPTHTTVNGQTAVSFTIAVNTSTKKKDGTGYESNFYNVSIWGYPAERVLERCQKGTQVEVIGDLVAENYVNKTTQEKGQALNIKAWKVTPRARFKGNKVANDSNDGPDERPY